MAMSRGRWFTFSLRMLLVLTTVTACWLGWQVQIVSDRREILLCALIFIAAVLYSSVGHGGASGYLAAMALFGVAPESMKPAALVLNILVATIGTVQFHRAGCFSWPTFWPLAAGSIPLAFIGGAWSLPGTTYRIMLGAVLMAAALRLSMPPRTADPQAPAHPYSKKVWIPIALVCGAAIGLVSGLIGVGGGIFLTPLLLLAGWAQPRAAAGISVTFILVNSIAGISGYLTGGHTLAGVAPQWIIAALAGGLIGSGLGSRRLDNTTLRRLLAVVLVIAGIKLFLT